jgi:GT2 family glycosyltransferase
MTSSNEWPPSLKPYRDYVTTSEGNKKIAEKPADGSVGIVIPVKNGLKFFKLCFHSVLSFTDHPYLITVVDNQSDLDTRKYFWSMHKNHQVYLLRYDDEFNFAAEVNLGLRHVFSFPEVKYGLILNADTVVTPGWLSNMVNAINSFNPVGAVGPLTNQAIPEQMDLSLIGKIEPSQRLSGMCMLIRREAFEDVGGFDEEYVGGTFEDWDICERMHRKGWHIIIDGNTYIFHFYKKFRRDDHNEAVKRNEELFFKKNPLVLDLVKRGHLVREK